MILVYGGRFVRFSRKGNNQRQRVDVHPDAENDTETPLAVPDVRTRRPVFYSVPVSSHVGDTDWVPGLQYLDGVRREPLGRPKAFYQIFYSPQFRVPDDKYPAPVVLQHRLCVPCAPHFGAFIERNQGTPF